MISNLFARISNLQRVIGDVYISTSQESLGILSFQIRVWVKFIQNTFLNTTRLTWLLERSMLLERADHLSKINHLSGINCLGGPFFLKNHFKNILSSKMIPNFFIPQRNLLWHKLNISRCTYDFLLLLIFNGKQVII